jgi:hypothetical protein
MVPTIKYYLVGGYLRGDSPRHDVDIVGVLEDGWFRRAFGFSHLELMEAYKEKPHGDKLEKYLLCNKIMGWVLTQIFSERVDFKWILPTMLYKPSLPLKLELNVLMYL